MNVDKYSDEFLERLVRSFVAYSAEPTWFEFKRNCADVMRLDGLIEGRYPNVYAAAVVARRTGDEAAYLGVRGFDTKFYKQRILEFICLKNQASAKEVFEAARAFLPAGRSLADNRRKITSLLSVIMSAREGLIKTARPHASTWILTQKGAEICKTGNVSCRRECQVC